MKYNRREAYLRLLQTRLAFLKGEKIPAEDLLSLAKSLKMNVHGQTVGKLRTWVRSIDNKGDIELRFPRKVKAESLRGCKILALEIYIHYLTEGKNG